MKACYYLILVLLLQVDTVFADDTHKVKVIASYGKILEQLRSDAKGVPESEPPLTIEEKTNSNGDVVEYAVWGHALVKFFATSNQLKSVSNLQLRSDLGKKGYGFYYAQLGFSDAVERAKVYLDSYGIKLPESVRLKTVAFDRAPFPGAWEVRWEPVWGGYAQDEFVSLPETAWVIFHEQLGLQSVGSGIMAPAPASLVVTISRDEAIYKAERLVADVMRTPYYRMARREGFKATALDSCELKVVKPNWLLDPQRASWPSPEEVIETRLCWMVRFNTDVIGPDVDTKLEDGTVTKLKRPDIVIYIDAATGECVGAGYS